MLVRRRYANNASAVDLNKEMPGHVDIPRLKKGKVGGFFWLTLLLRPHELRPSNEPARV